MFISSLYKAREESGELFFFNAQSLYIVHNSYLINTYSMNHQHLDGTVSTVLHNLLSFILKWVLNEVTDILKIFKNSFFSPTPHHRNFDSTDQLYVCLCTT